MYVSPEIATHFMAHAQSVSIQLSTGYVNTNPNASAPVHNASPKPALV